MVVGDKMKNKKETTKSVVLTFLIISSILLSYISNTYQPDYEIFNIKSNKKSKITKNNDLNSLLYILTPSIVYKTEENIREENSLPNTITKLGTVDASRDRTVIKDMLKEIASTNTVETRIRNRGIEEILSTNTEKISLNYSITLDSALVKQIFFSDENNNVSLEFDTITLLKDKPTIIYLYKRDSSNYIQIDLKNNIYDKILEIFNNNKKTYSKYSLNNKVLYLKEYSGDVYEDEYSAEDVNIAKLGKEIFEDKENFKTSGNELTDGYAILREIGNKIIYVNPSNEDSKTTTVQSSTNYAVNFISSGYIFDVNYQIVSASERLTTFREVFKDSLVFSDDNSTEIVVQSNLLGVYQVNSSKKIPKTYLSSKKLKQYDLEQIDFVLNYLYKIGIKGIDDVVLGYRRTYNKTSNSFTYTPTWYIKYNGKYVQFKKLQELVSEKGAV